MRKLPEEERKARRKEVMARCRDKNREKYKRSANERYRTDLEFREKKKQYSRKGKVKTKFVLIWADPKDINRDL